MARRRTAGWGQPAPGWGQAFPGWDALADSGPLPLRAAGSLHRWWWPITAIVGFLTVVGYVLARDNPHPGLSNRGWLTLVLAAVVVVLLTIHRGGRGGPPRAPLARALAEYAVVALLAALLATAGARQQPTGQAEAGAGRRQSATERQADRRPPGEQVDAGAADHRPGIVRVVTGVWAWLAELWHSADQQADRPTSATSTTTPRPSARGLAAPAPATWRSCC
jgi:hypothetical protein